MSLSVALPRHGLARAMPAGARLRALAARALLPGLLLLLALPLTLTDLPPLLDYPNHLARMHVLVSRATHPAVAAMYNVQWRLIPNIGMDLVVPLLARVMPLDVAGRLFMLVALLLPPLGAIMLHRAAFGGRSPWPLVACGLAYNGIFFAGFMNYLVAIGLAFAGAALWLRSRRILPRVAVGTALSAACFLCHFLGWVFYALLVASIELGRLRGGAWRDWRRAWPRLALGALPFLPELASVLLRAATMPPAATVPDANAALWFRWKLLGVLTPTVGYVRWLDAGTLLLLLALIAWPALRGRLRVYAPLAPVVLLAAAAFVLLPFCTHTAAFIDTRVPIVGMLALIAITAPRTLPRWLAGAFALASVLRVATIAFAFQAHNADLTAYRAAIAPVPSGARVAVVSARGEPARGPEPLSRTTLLAMDALTHVAGLLLIEHDAFWPLLFNAPGKQPVVVRPPYDRLSMRESWLPSFRELTAPTPEGRQVAPYLAHWQRDFDYVLLVYADRLADPAAVAPGRLDLLRATSVAALYRVVPPDATAPAGDADGN